MPSIRKAKKRLKREIEEARYNFYTAPSTNFRDYLLADAMYDYLQLLKQDLQQLSHIKTNDYDPIRKKRGGA